MSLAYIGMGGNLSSRVGAPSATLAAAVLRLESLGRIVGRSSLYSTEPVGYADQPRFVNAVVALETELGPRELLGQLMAIEKEFGRDRSAAIANGPRTLDLDLLLWGNRILNEPDLVVPHPRLAERAFVLVPLCEIAPEAMEPVQRKSFARLLGELRLCLVKDPEEVVRISAENWCACALHSCAERVAR
jgi:2-amino-4-hydroxy-6-hydroxymethyldihydropteridine diphosphokinase